MEDQQTFLSSFGELLKTHRKRKRLTQKQLAQQLGMHANTISSWELGTYLPDTRGLVLELARHLALDEQETRQLLEASLTALSPHWLVPLPRNPFFTGREKILEALHTHLHVEQVVALTQSYALRGLGGIGKTQIALEYAYRHALEYSAIFWIEAETIEHVMSSLLRIAELLQLPERQEAEQQRIVAAVQRWLSTHSQWLLIWDNVEDLELLQRLLPPTRQGAVLITTRHQALGTLARGMDLSPMGREEGMLFVLRRAKVLEPEATSERMHQLAVSMPAEYASAEKLVAAMGGVPLALDQAGAYIEETGCSVSTYLQRYEEQHARLLDRRGVLGGDHPHSVTATFLLASKRIEREQSAAADLLHVCVLLHAEAIPEELFVAGAAYLGPELASLATDPCQLDQLIAVLRSLSLVQRQPETRTLSMHRLVQAVLRDRMSEPEQAEWLRRVIAALNAVFPDVTHEAWRQCERLLPHVLTVATAIPDCTGDRELAEALQKAADYLCDRARFEQAEPLYQRALCIGKRVWGPAHPQVAYPLCGLAYLFYEQGKYQQAEPLYQRALQIREQVLGPTHPDVASTLERLGLLYWKEGKYEQAKLLYQRALYIQEQAKGAEHAEIAHLLNDLAILSVEQGEHEQGERLYQRALSIWERALGANHPDVALPLNNLADLYIQQGMYEQAEPLCEQALRIWKQALGAEHPEVAYPLRHLADLYMEQGKYERAEPLYQQALHIWEQALGPEHPNLAYPFHGLAILFTRQGKYEQAEPLYQQALHIWEQALGPEHPQVAHPFNNLASLYTEQGKYEQAELLFQRALTLREKHFGRHHPEIAQTLHDLAIFYQKQGNLSEAISLTERALEIRSQSLGDAHPKTVATRTLYTQLKLKIRIRV
jgi:tetratricopeptide (TPR) repeat protein/transcriptional regulator with XRE-family HTH domain